jgi:hypothetical protein
MSIRIQVHGANRLGLLTFWMFSIMRRKFPATDVGQPENLQRMARRQLGQSLTQTNDHEVSEPKKAGRCLGVVAEA